RGIATRSQGDARLSAEVATFMHTLVADLGDNISIGRMLIDENLLPETAQASIYRAIHQRLTDQAAASFGTSRYATGYFTGGETIYPGRDLAEFRRRFVDYLIRTRGYDEARLLLATIKHEMADARLALDTTATDNTSSEDQSRYGWVP